MRNEAKSDHSFPALPSRRLIGASALGLVLLWAALLPACGSGSRGDSGTTSSQEGRPAVHVSFVSAQRKDLVRKITLPGTLVAFNEATLYGKVAGYVRSISVDKGDKVRPGQTLAIIDVPEMAEEVEQAAAAYREAVASLKRARAEAELQAATYERYRQVSANDPDAISKQELDQYRSKFEVADADVKLAEARVETARANHDRLVVLSRYAAISAPFSGTVTARYVDPGALIQAATASIQGQPLVTIQDLCSIRVYVNVPEVDVSFIHMGTPASLTTPAHPGKGFPASVTRYAEALDPATRTMKTEIDVRNPSHPLRPGMYADVTLELEKRPGAVVIPATALVVEGQKRFVYVVQEGKARRLGVEVGFDDGAKVEIRSGLKGGEQVIVAGKENLADGKAVEASPDTATKS